MNEKWALILVAGNTWNGVSTNAYNISKDIGNDRERSSWSIGSHGCYWTGEGKRPNIDAIIADIKEIQKP